MRPRNNGNNIYTCPTGYVPCGGAEGVQALADNRVEYVICTTGEDESLCPITDLHLDITEVDVDEKDLTGIPSKDPVSLPISSFKFSTSTPCINFNNEPGT